LYQIFAFRTRDSRTRDVEFTSNEFLVPIKKAVPETARLEPMSRTDIKHGSEAHKKFHLESMVHPGGFEPSTLCSEDRCSNPLSYGCKRRERK
jgi:hypothetical protein